VGWKPFSFDLIDLATLDEKMGGESGLVYSTNPVKAIGLDGESYIVKGPEPEVVFPELAGCVLASAVGITVPCARACRAPVGILAGSREVSGLRIVEPWLRRSRHVTNFNELFSVIVADIWLGNVDRNMGNIVGNPVGGERIELVFIDFEKSATLRPSPFINTGMIDPRQLWPKNELGQILREIKPLVPPAGMIERIGEIDEYACRNLLQPVARAVGTVTWAEASQDLLARRARQIQRLTEEVWNS
jgi:hypothetical protein